MQQINFLCVGPQRTASSWLDRALRSHPELCFSAHVKETFFFDRNFERGLGWYFDLFENSKDSSLLGEVGSTYFECAEARQRIFKHNPSAKIIIMVRNPVARSFSSFGHEYTKGRAGEDFFEAVAKQPRIVDSGRYLHLAPKWENAFGRKQIFYLMQEDIQENPQAQIEAVCSFLGVKPISLPQELQGKYGQRSVPRYPLLAAAASRSASALRGAGMHRVVEIGKKLGLKMVYRGGD
ncbi:MAG: sulfotransferase family protein, partial [Bacteroidota bacterium]